MRFFSHFILRRAGFVAAIGTLLALVGAFYSVKLFKNLKTDFEELLPTTARSVVNLGEVRQRLESIDNLAVLVFSKDSIAGKNFVNALVEKLDRLPKDLVTSVEYKIDQEISFFRDRQALYMDLSDLAAIRNYIHDRIDYEKELYNPLNIFRKDEIPAPYLNFESMRNRYGKRLESYDAFPEGYYATPDGTRRAILVYVPGSIGMDGKILLRKRVDEIVATAHPKTFAPDLEVKYSGGVEDAIEENGALVADLELSTIVVIVLVTFAMWAFFRAVRATAALVVSLFMGTFWTFGISYFLVGYLNANSAFLGSIVIGNGINFGIIFLARYLEERRKGYKNTRAVHIAMTRTATPTVTAALAAGLSYGSLIIMGFRGFNQFGVIGLLGMVLCWISAFTLLPAYLTVLDRFSSVVPKKRKIPKNRLSNSVANFVGKFPRAIWGATFILTIASLSTFVLVKTDVLETDLANLRNKESFEHGSAFLYKYLDEIFQHYLSPTVILPHSRETARKIAAILKQKRSEEGEETLIATVQSLDDFVPTQQYEKIKILREIHELLPPKLLEKLDPQDQAKVSRFILNAPLKPITIADIPPLIIKKFTEKNGAVGNLVLVEPPLTDALKNGNNLVKFISDLRNATDQVEPGAPVAGTLSISSDMITAISRDGPRATVFAFLAVVLLVIFLFRDFKTISLVLFALILGVVWLGGIILGFGLKINFLNFIALPITFGIGVDYGVNIFQRYRQDGSGNILNIIKNTGGAVGLCSLTTVIGYCSLLIAGNQGFVSFGRLAVCGEIACVIAAVVSLPAYLILRKRRDHLDI